MSRPDTDLGAALYEVADGEIVVRFKDTDGAVQVAADLLTKGK